MKLRAPRCSEAISVTWFPARHCSHFTGAGASTAAVGASSAARLGMGDSAAAAANSHAAPAHRIGQRLTMLRGSIRDSLGNALDRIDARIPGHQQEEREVRHDEYARDGHVDALRRLHTQ